MSDALTPETRAHLADALTLLRAKLERETRQKFAWQAYALALEAQMRREGWQQADLDELGVARPK